MLRVQRRLAAQLLKCGERKVTLSPMHLEEIKEAITKADIRVLINNGIITRKRAMNTSRFWAKMNKDQKIHGRRKGSGSRKGKKTARSNPKRAWMNKIRLQREYLQSLRDKGVLTKAVFHEMYAKSKGGYFRSRRHMKLYLGEKGISK